MQITKPVRIVIKKRTTSLKVASVSYAKWRVVWTVKQTKPAASVIKKRITSWRMESVNYVKLRDV